MKPRRFIPSPTKWERVPEGRVRAFFPEIPAR